MVNCRGLFFLVFNEWLIYFDEILVLKEMNYIVKFVVLNKLFFVGKNLGWDDKDD